MRRSQNAALMSDDDDVEDEDEDECGHKIGITRPSATEEQEMAWAKDEEKKDVIDRRKTFNEINPAVITC